MYMQVSVIISNLNRYKTETDTIIFISAHHYAFH